MHTKSLGLTLTLAIALITLGYAYTASANKPDENGKHNHGDDGGGGGDGTIPVMVTFRDLDRADDDVEGVYDDRVRSDGGGAYIDGVDKVSTAVGHEGSFYLKRSRGNQEAKRKLILDFSICNSDCTLPPCVSECTALRGKVGNGGPDGVNLSAMDVHAEDREPYGLFISMHLGEDNGGFFVLHFDGLTRTNCGSQSAFVTHPAADTWVIEGRSACLEELDGTLRGAYDMPFQMEIKAL